MPRAPSAVIVLIAAVAACSPGVRTPSPDATPSAWGPLAVYASDWRGQALSHGTLRIDGSCVFLEESDGSRVMLAWPYPETVWDPEAGRITVNAAPPGTSGSAQTGQSVVLGGGGMGLSREGLRPEEYVEWMWPPPGECLANISRILFVSGIEDRPAPSTPLEPTSLPTPAADFGPLAVVETGDFPFWDSLIRGTLVITDDCVFIESDSRRELVVWPKVPDYWRWDAATREIVSLRFGPERREKRFSSGDRVMLGGGDIDDPAQDEILESIQWLVPPRQGCMTPIVFFSNGEISEP